MIPFRQDPRKRMAFIFAIATGLGFVFVSQTYLALTISGRVFVAKEQFLQAFTSWYLWAAFFPAISALAARFGFEAGAKVRSVAFHIAAGIGFAIAHLSIQTLISSSILGVPITWNLFLGVKFVSGLFWRLFVYLSILTICVAFDLRRRWQQAETESARIESGILRAQIDSLKMQIDPEFLFRSLRRLSKVMHDNVDEADTMVARLGDYLRMTLDTARKSEVTLREEIELFQCYLEVQNASEQHRLDLDLAIDPEAMSCTVPAQLLQAPVEDAIIHGSAFAAYRFLVAAEKTGFHLVLRIEDEGASQISGHPRLEDLVHKWNALYTPPIVTRSSTSPGGIEIQVPLKLRKRGPEEFLQDSHEEIKAPEVDIQTSPVRKWLIIIGVITLLAAYFTISTLLPAASSGTKINWPVQLLTSSGWYVWALITPVVLKLASRFPLQRKYFLKHFSIHLASFVALWVAASLMIAFIHWAANLGDYSFIKTLPTFLGRSPYSLDVICYAVIFAVQRALTHQRNLEESRLYALRLESQLARASLHALKMQLHPHFLFNALNSLSELMQEDREAAEKMIVHLETFLKLTLNNSQRQEVPFEEELEFLRSYLAIENIRFQDRLNVKMTIGPQTLRVPVPNLVLQPIVENAIKHGVAPRRSAGQIEIDAQRDNGILRVCVKDNGPGLNKAGKKTPPRTGVGLSNTRERLHQLYGTAHRFEMINGPEGGLIVSFEVPVRNQQ